MNGDTSLADYRDRHRGETIVVCGCGKSAPEIKDPGRLVTIGVNDIGRILDPTYLVVVNPREHFTADRFRYIENSRANAIFTQLQLPVAHPRVVRFRLGVHGGTDLTDADSLPYTGNSPYVAVCLAAYMGAARIGLVGVDFTDHHFFRDSGRHPLSNRLARIDREYAELAAALAEQGVELVNLSDRSRLVSLPRVDCRAFCRSAGGGAMQAPADGAADGERGDLAASAPRSAGETAADRLKVVHVARTNCAGAIWNLHDLLNRYTGVRSRVVTASTVTSGRSYPKDVLLSEVEKVGRLLEDADLIHFHNRIDGQSAEMRPFAEIVRRKPAVLQFHSEPDVLRRDFPGRDPRTRRDIPTLVVAQKQARFFPHAVAVPNAIDIHEPLLGPAHRPRNGRIRVLYTPTDTRDHGDRRATCSGKGYGETLRVLSDLESRGAIEAIVRTRVPWRELMELRRGADVVIDECVTGGYHLTSLEGLSQGLVTIAFLDRQTRRLLGELTGSSESEIPWVNTPIDRLAQTLLLLGENPMVLDACRERARPWMERYWAPKVIAGHYLKAYRRAIGQHAAARMDRLSSCHADPSPDAVPQCAGARDEPGSTSERVATPAPAAGGVGGGVLYTIKGQRNPRRSEDYPQTVRLGPALLSRGGTLSGRPCHILGNGPSVREFDLSLLRSRTVIGVNATTLLHEALDRTPDYYCVTDRRFLQDDHARRLVHGARRSVRVFAGYCHGYVADPDVHYVRICGGDGISEDIRDGFYHCCSVALFAAQLALWLGCGDLYLHGCEFDYKNGRFCESQNGRPHDRGTYDRVARNVRALAERLASRGSGLYVVGPSRLVGDFGARPVPGVRAATPSQLEAAARPTAQSGFVGNSGFADAPGVSGGSDLPRRT